MLIFLLIIIGIYLYYNINKYNKSTYHRLTENSVLSVCFDKGKYGEYLIYDKLKEYENHGCQFLFNVYIPKENGETTEADVLLISKKGIFVFESKNYSGWIFGNEKAKMWTQSLPVGKGKTQKNHFYNPIFQNKNHINNLKKVLDEDIPMFSIITFSERCSLKAIPLDTYEVKIAKRNMIDSLVAKMYSEISDCMEPRKVFEIYKKLYMYSQVSEELKTKHIENIQNKV